jgi:hypothetical protein
MGESDFNIVNYDAWSFLIKSLRQNGESAFIALRFDGLKELLEHAGERLTDDQELSKVARLLQWVHSVLLDNSDPLEVPDSVLEVEIAS